VVGGAEFVLTATGSAFQENSSVLWNGSVLPTTYVSATTLTATVAAGLLTTPGTVDVTVRTPAPGGGQSTTLPFEVGNAAPVLQAIAPTTGVVGGPEFVLTATGSGFQQNSNVLWNGSALPTTYVSQTTLTATVATTLLTAAGSAEVAVTTPQPGGGVTASLPFALENPVPTVSGTSPTSVVWRSGEFVLTVSGNGFVNTSEILWNGIARATNFQSFGELTTTIPAGEILTVGPREVAVRNPAPGGGTSAAVIFDVILDPAITSYSTVALRAADVTYEPVGGRLYASVIGTDPTYPNSVVVIDPVSAAVVDQIGAGSEPGPLAVSDDGRYLYVGLDGAAEVRRITLASGTVDLTIALGADPFFGPFYAEDLVVPPGAPNQVVVSRYRKGVSPRHGGLAIFDDGVQRPDETQDHTGSNRIEPSATGALLYGYNNETTEFGLREVLITPTGLTQGAVWSNRVTGFGVDIAYADGNIFSTGGAVVTAATGNLAGTFPLEGVWGPVAPDPANGRVLFLVEGMRTALEAYRLSTYARIASVEMPGSGFRRLVRWGTDGLAYVSDAGVSIVTTTVITQ
jgi:hypothetical protein